MRELYLQGKHLLLETVPIQHLEKGRVLKLVDAVNSKAGINRLVLVHKMELKGISLANIETSNAPMPIWKQACACFLSQATVQKRCARRRGNL
jgi:hypothetical protein